ncbi:MAG: N-acetyltransferase [Sphingobacteriaceae bacterium]|nr:N-acetyltransferase [Cytophagaceae bacterium]
MPQSFPPISRNESERRFELLVDGKLSVVEYQQRDAHTLALTHTEVDPALEGHGVGSAMVKGVLDYLRENNLRLVPLCPFVRTYLQRHPDYQDLVRGS